MSGARHHSKAFVALFDDDADLTMFRGHVKGQAPQRYAIAFAQRPEHRTTRASETPRANLMGVTVHSVGPTPEDAEWVADRVESRVTPGIPGVRLVVKERTQGVIKHDGGLPMRVDSASTPAVYFFADDYVWEIQ